MAVISAFQQNTNIPRDFKNNQPGTLLNVIGTSSIWGNHFATQPKSAGLPDSQNQGRSIWNG